MPKRDQTLQSELIRQQRNEGLRRKFAEKANGVGPWIERHIDAVAAIGMGMQGSLEEQLMKLRQYEEAVNMYKVHMEEMEKIHQEVQENMIFENRYTQYTMEVSTMDNVQFYLLNLVFFLDSTCRMGTVVNIDPTKY